MSQQFAAIRDAELEPELAAAVVIANQKLVEAHGVLCALLDQANASDADFVARGAADEPLKRRRFGIVVALAVLEDLCSEFRGDSEPLQPAAIQEKETER